MIWKYVVKESFIIKKRKKIKQEEEQKIAKLNNGDLLVA